MERSGLSRENELLNKNREGKEERRGKSRKDTKGNETDKKDVLLLSQPLGSPP